MKKHRAFYALWALAAALTLMLRLCPAFAAAWQARLSQPLTLHLHALTARAPFALVERIALVLSAVLGLRGLRAAAALLRRKPAPLGGWMRALARVGLLCYVPFAALWMPAMMAAPAPPRMPADEAALIALCDELVAALNTASDEIPAPADLLRRAADVAGLPGGAVKAARFPQWLRAGNLAGVYSPWTAEAVVDASLPRELLPFTAVHELIHLRGIADEGAANIAAWQACVRQGGAFADSARLWALRYALGMLRAADSAACDALLARMTPRTAQRLARCQGEAVVSGEAERYLLLVDWLAGNHTLKMD